MIIDKGFTGKSNFSVMRDPSDRNGENVERYNATRRSAALVQGRSPMDVVMIHTNDGKTQDIVTGTPPAFKEEARSAWAKRRDEASIEGLFK
jgi:hypothetical protein